MHRLLIECCPKGVVYPLSYAQWVENVRVAALVCLVLVLLACVSEAAGVADLWSGTALASQLAVNDLALERIHDQCVVACKRAVRIVG